MRAWEASAFGRLKGVLSTRDGQCFADHARGNTHAFASPHFRGRRTRCVPYWLCVCVSRWSLAVNDDYNWWIEIRCWLADGIWWLVEIKPPIHFSILFKNLLHLLKEAVLLWWTVCRILFIFFVFHLFFFWFWGFYLSKEKGIYSLEPKVKEDWIPYGTNVKDRRIIPEVYDFGN